MSKTHLAVIILLFLNFQCTSSAQEALISKDCDCSIAFEDLVNKLESNYIALKQIQLNNKDAIYKQRKLEYANKAKTILAENCAEFLDEFLDYFKDGHLHVIERPKYSDVELQHYKSQIKTDKLDRVSVQNLLSQGAVSNRESNHRLIGSWTDGNSKFIVIEEGNFYKAYVAETMREGIEAGELKAIFKPKNDGYSIKYFSYKFNPVYLEGDVYKDGQLLRAGHLFWKRVESSFNLKQSQTDKLDHPKLDILNTKTTLLTIPSFNHDYKVFRDFIRKNELIIKSSTTLIIDIRGNRGGNGIYFPLIELYATQNMPGSQGLVLASKDNLAYFQRQMNYANRIYKPVVKRIEEHFGEIVDGPLYPEKKYKKRDNHIKHVAILTDKGCASAAESFILHSKRASNKVKTFGGATAGMIDYTSVNIVLLESGSQNIYLAYPTSTLHKEIPEKGYNVTGVIPDISIGNSNQDKIGFITNYYRQ